MDYSQNPVICSGYTPIDTEKLMFWMNTGYEFYYSCSNCTNCGKCGKSDKN